MITLQYQILLGLVPRETDYFVIMSILHSLSCSYCLRSLLLVPPVPTVT